MKVELLVCTLFKMGVRCFVSSLVERQGWKGKRPGICLGNFICSGLRAKRMEKEWKVVKSIAPKFLSWHARMFCPALDRDDFIAAQDAGALHLLVYTPMWLLQKWRCPAALHSLSCRFLLA